MLTDTQKTIKLSELPANELLIDNSGSVIRLVSTVRAGVREQQREYLEREWFTVAGLYVLDYGPDLPVEID